MHLPPDAGVVEGQFMNETMLKQHGAPNTPVASI